MTFLEALEHLKSVKHHPVISIRSQYERGRILTSKQEDYFIALAKQHLISLERGFTGLDHGVSYVEKAQKIFEYLWRYKEKYRKSDINNLLDSLGVDVDKRLVIDELNRKKYLWFVVDSATQQDTGDAFQTLKDFVIFMTDNDPSNPFASGIKVKTEINKDN